MEDNIMMNQKMTLINNNYSSINEELKNKKLQLLFNEMDPQFDENNEDDVDRKELYVTKFDDIYYKINKMENEIKINKKEKRLIINFYDICKKDIYFDFEQKIENLISLILSKIYNDIGNFVIMRSKKNQTTKSIIDNPIHIIYLKTYKTFLDEHRIPLYFEILDNNLFSLDKKTGCDIGLKEGSQIQLKINNKLIKNYDIMINCIFKTTKGSEHRFLISKNSTVESVLKKYCHRIDKRYEEIDGEICFLCNAVLLNKIPNEKIRKFCHFGNIKIVVNDIYNLIGAGCSPSFISVDFVDVSSGHVKKLYFSETAPVYRKVNKGLNIFGTCNNSKCLAFKKEVIYPTKLNDKLVFNLNENLLNIKCPICKKIIKPKTCGFWECEYQFVGKKIQEGELVEFDSKTKETKDSDFEYYDAFENGETQWIELTIYVLPKQKMKY